MGQILTNTAGLTSSRIPQYYQKKLLTHAIDYLRLDQFGTQYDLPKYAGTLTQRFFKRSIASSSDVQNITEGTVITGPSNSTLTPIDVELSQYGDFIKLSDTRKLTDLINQMDIEIRRMGESAALHFDDLIREEIVTGVVSGGQKRYAQGITNFNALVAAANADACLTVRDLDIARTQLEDNRAPLFKDKTVVAIVSPRGAYDLRRDEEWQKANQPQHADKIFKGEIGTIFGVRVVVATNPWKEEAVNDTEGTFNANGTIDTAIVVGMEAYATVKLAGTSSPMAPQLIYNDKPDKSDPLNQFVTAGWKGWYAAKLLDEKFAVTMRHKSTFNA